MARGFVEINGQKVRTYLNNPKLKGVGNKIQFTQEQLDEYIKCALDPVYFAAKYVKIVSLDEGIVPFDMRDYQKEMIETYSKNRFTITLASRQIGKSITVLCGFLLHEILFKDHQNTAILANKGALARDQLSKLKMAYENLPMWMQQGVVTWNKGYIELENGSAVVAAATSASSVRGNSYNTVILDEFAHVETNLQEEFFESTYPTLSSGKHTKLIIISTPKGMNLFYKIWMESITGRNEFKNYRVDWWQVPGRDEKWKEETIRNIGQRKFDQEYGNEFVGSDETLISGAKLRALVWDVPIYEDTKGLKIYKQPVKDRPYVMLVDTAEGLNMDSSAVSVIDVGSVPYEQVAVYRNNEISTMLFPTVVAEIGKKYNDAYALVEINSVGKQVADILQIDLEYENVLMVDQNPKKGQFIGGGYTKKSRFGVKMSTSTKQIGCSNLKTLVENDKLLIHDETTIMELFTFVAHNNTFKAEEGKNDDMAMTLVLFGWLTTQKYFNDMTDIALQNKLREENIDGIMESLTPVGFFNSGRPEDEPQYFIEGGEVWQKV